MGRVDVKRGVPVTWNVDPRRAAGGPDSSDRRLYGGEPRHRVDVVRLIDQTERDTLIGEKVRGELGPEIIELCVRDHVPTDAIREGKSVASADPLPGRRGITAAVGPVI